MKPRRISMGCYAVEVNGTQIVLQRVPGRGFKIVMRPGRKAKLFRRLRDAAAAAVEAADPWPFSVEKKPDLALDIPQFLRRPK